MIQIDQEIEPVHDEFAVVMGAIETHALEFYDIGDCVPTAQGCFPQPPCLVSSEIDEELCTPEFKLMKPTRWIKLTPEQADFIKKHYSYIKE
jgi:hypothetical protein